MCLLIVCFMVLNVCTDPTYLPLSQNSLVFAGFASLLREVLSFSGFRKAAIIWGVAWIIAWLIMLISAVFIRIAPSVFRKCRYYISSP